MPYNRRMTRRFADRSIVRKSSGWLGGMCLDGHPDTLEQGEFAYLLNYVPFRGELQTRKGQEALTTSTIANSNLNSRQPLYHKIRNSIFVHIGTSLYYSDDDFATYTEITGLPDNPSTLVQYEKEILIFTDSGVFTTGLNHDVPATSVFQLNAANPAVNLQLEGSKIENQGDYRYRFAITYARYETIGGQSVLVSESGTKDITDFWTEIGMNEPLNSSNHVWVSNTNTIPAPWTHLRVYRTLNIGPGKDSVTGEIGQNVNDPYTYYLIGQMNAADLAASSEQAIGTMVIGSTFVVGGAETFLIWNSDKELVESNPTVLSRVGYKPLPSSKNGNYISGFIWTFDENFLYYGPVTSGFIGFYSEAYQFDELGDAITAVIPGPQSVTITCRSSTYRLSTGSFTNPGNVNFGESVIVFYKSELIDNRIGVLAVDTIQEFASGAYLALCSDGAVRSWDTQKWANNYSRDKVQTETFEIEEDAYAVYHPDGYYLLFYTIGAQERCLRLGLNESEGIGWSFYGGNTWTTPDAVFAHVDVSTGRYRVVGFYPGATFISLMIIGSGDTDLGSSPTFVANGPWYTGSSNGFNCIHQESNLTVRTSSGDLTLLNLNFSVAGEDSEDTLELVGIPNKQGVYIARSLGLASGSYIQVSWVASGTEHIITELETRFRVQDRQVNTIDYASASDWNPFYQNVVVKVNDFVPRDSIKTATFTPAIPVGDVSRITEFHKAIPDYNGFVTLSEISAYAVLFWVKGSGSVTVDGEVIPVTADWVHYAIVDDGLNFKTYIDGVLDSTVVSRGSLGPTMPLVIADADVWDFRVYSNVLSDALIADYYSDIVNNDGGNVL